VCWIRNTVDDAIRAYDSLKTHGVDVELFHARFAASDRQAIEERSLARYGKSSTPALRRGGVLVATQVVEQSLDVDFDEMVSDIAPIDLLIQRIGRMRRHVRDKDGTYLGPDHTDERGEAWINILCPDPSIVEGPEWFSGMFPGGAAVYPAVDVIWRTARDLFSREQLVLPSQSRELVEEAYGESPVPEVLDQRRTKPWQRTLPNQTWVA
jgi:CRISPR-associated endonuclease/helicase Cas3